MRIILAIDLNMGDAAEKGEQSDRIFRYSDILEIKYQTLRIEPIRRSYPDDLSSSFS